MTQPPERNETSGRRRGRIYIRQHQHDTPTLAACQEGMTERHSIPCTGHNTKRDKRLQTPPEVRHDRSTKSQRSPRGQDPTRGQALHDCPLTAIIKCGKCCQTHNVPNRPSHPERRPHKPQRAPVKRSVQGTHRRIQRQPQVLTQRARKNAVPKVVATITRRHPRPTGMATGCRLPGRHHGSVRRKGPTPIDGDPPKRFLMTVLPPQCPQAGEHRGQPSEGRNLVGRPNPRIPDERQVMH